MFKNKRVTLLFSVVLFTFGVIFFSLAIQKYQVLIQSRADGNVISIDFGTTNEHGDKLMIEMGLQLSDINETASVDQIIQYFDGTPTFVRVVDPEPAIVDHDNFSRLQEKGFFWYFSSDTYAGLTAIAEKYFEKYPDGRAILELTNHDVRSIPDTEALATQFPHAIFFASNYINWPRDKVRELVTESNVVLTHPSLHGVSFYADAGQGLDNVAENVALFWDTFFDASTDIAGTSVKINWPHKKFNLALSEIKTANPTNEADIIKDESQKFGILLSAFFNYVQMRGDEDRLGTNNNIPIRYVGLGDISDLRSSAKSIAKVFSLMSKDQMPVVYPDTGSGTNLRDQKPLYGFVAYKEAIGYRLVFTNTGSDAITLQLPRNKSFDGYTSVSNIRGQINAIEPENKIVFQPYEVIAVFKGDLPNSSPTQTQPTLPAEAANQLVCDPGSNPYNSDSMVVTNNTQETINNLTSVTFRCKYIPNKIREGFYKCETCEDSDEVNNPDCQIGIYDPNSSIEAYSLAPGESKTINVRANRCEIIQFDTYNTASHADDSNLECYNIRSQQTNPGPPARWPGGIAFGINQNSDGYNETTQTCAAVSNTPAPTIPTNTPPENATSTPVPSETPTMVPPTETPSPTNTPVVPTDTPRPTETPSPTNTPIPPTPTSTPVPPTPTIVQQLTVDKQPPGSTSWSLILVPIGIIILGLLL